MSEDLCLRVEAPVCAFRPHASREYQDTYPVPTPSAVYGMLLSLIGVERRDKARHRGAELALAVDRLPSQSKVFRKLRRGLDLENVRPDYQDLLIDLGLWVWVGRGRDQANPCLVEQLRAGLANPAAITRRGGLSLGESGYLVDVVSVAPAPESAVFIAPDPKGFYSLTTWVDHADMSNTLTRRFRVDDEPRLVVESLTTARFLIGE